MDSQKEENHTDEGDDCPDCPNQGWYYIGTYGEQEPCMWCYLNPDSKFTKQQNKKV